MQINSGDSAGNFYPAENAVKLLPVNAVVGPAAVPVDTVETLLADATDVNKSLHGHVTIQNRGPESIFIAVGLSPTVGPGLTVANGIEILATQSYTIDFWGGSALWAITTVLQVAPADTRVSGSKKV
jgi:hypothetical protein